MTRSHLLAVARGDAPADLLLTGARPVNVFTGEVEPPTDVAIAAGRIAGLGPGYSARQTLDLSGLILTPGLIDAHVHIESSMCLPAEFARAVLPRGVTCAVTDPHEIANVMGPGGVELMHKLSRGLPLEVVVMAPSCVPATGMADGGGRVEAGDIERLRGAGVAHGLAELMNFPGAISHDADLLAKIDAMRGRPVDGHCPGVRGRPLNAYIAAGVGSDHESVTVEEAHEKLARGLYLLIREATNARNLDTLLPVVTPANARRVCFCTDDRTAGDLLREGSIDAMVRRAIRAGIDPVEAVRMATLNPAEWFGLSHRGAIAPGRVADLVAVGGLAEFDVKLVIAGGKLAARDGRMAHDRLGAVGLERCGTCKVDWERVRLDVPANGTRVRVIGARADQLVTDHLVLDAKVSDGHIVADVSRDMLKMAVLERHGGSGRAGVGFIKGFGLRRGALAGTVAHDHHNLVLIGADDASMHAAGRAVTEMGGGLAVSDGDRVLARLPLPVGGLMSDRPVEEVAAGYDAVLDAARSLGATPADAFMAMSFMALEVIPALKLTEQGYVDVETFAPVGLFA